MNSQVITLRDFTGGRLPEARGSVYVWKGEPFMQLHLFDDDYTIFWLGQTNLPTLAKGFSNITDSSYDLLSRYGSRFTPWSRITMDAVTRDLGAVRLWGAQQDEAAFRKVIDVAEKIDSPEVETYFISADSDRHVLKVWGEAQRTTFNPTPDVGVTSDLPLIEEPTLRLFLDTALIRPDDLEPLFNSVHQETSRYLILRHDI